MLRDWLKTKQDRLSNTDAESPLGLADLVRRAARGSATRPSSYCRKAWKIDPNSKEIAEAFRSRGYRKVKDDWIEAVPEQTAKPDVPHPTRAGRGYVSGSKGAHGRGGRDANWGQTGPGELYRHRRAK